jgi:nucleotide-binding universal stress UspA family protein
MDLLVGYDGSPAANTAIRVGTRLFPDAHALITYVQTPPFAGRELRRRLRSSARNITELAETAEREGKHEAELLVQTGVALARSAGWDAEPLVKQVYSGEGIGLAQLAESHSPAAVVVGSRGLSGSDAVLGSVSELLVHHSPVPVLVSKEALLSSEYEALAGGPVVVGFDHSDGAAAAVTAAQQLFPGRQLLAISVAADEPGSATAGPPGGVTLVHAAPQRGRGSTATAHALIAVAAEHNAATIVVGSRGRSALRQIVVGSVARSVLRDSYRPVVVVPQDT